MNFIIIFQYSTTKIEREYKTFDNVHAAENWAERECISRGAKHWWVS